MTIEKYLPRAPYEEISSVLLTIKQFREYQNPSSASWKDYVLGIFHIFGFSTDEINSCYLSLNIGNLNNSQRILLRYVIPGNAFPDFLPGLPLGYKALYAAIYDTRWVLITDGLNLKIINFQFSLINRPIFWQNFDEIIQNENIVSFSKIYRVVSLIRHSLDEISTFDDRKFTKYHNEDNLPIYP